MSFPRFLRVVPCTLTRITNSSTTKLRILSHKRTEHYNIVAFDGFVEPRYRLPNGFKGSNGASVLPMGEKASHVVAKYRARKPILFVLPSGTQVPSSLVLVQDKMDHFSIEPARRMALVELEKRITSFLISKGNIYTRERWMKTFSSEK